MGSQCCLRLKVAANGIQMSNMRGFQVNRAVNLTFHHLILVVGALESKCMCTSGDRHSYCVRTTSWSWLKAENVLPQMHRLSYKYDAGYVNMAGGFLAKA